MSSHGQKASRGSRAIQRFVGTEKNTGSFRLVGASAPLLIPNGHNWARVGIQRDSLISSGQGCLNVQPAGSYPTSDVKGDSEGGRRERCRAHVRSKANSPSPFSSTSICSFITSPHAGAPTSPVPTVLFKEERDAVDVSVPCHPPSSQPTRTPAGAHNTGQPHEILAVCARWGMR